MNIIDKRLRPKPVKIDLLRSVRRIFQHINGPKAIPYFSRSEASKNLKNWSYCKKRAISRKRDFAAF